MVITDAVNNALDKYFLIDDIGVRASMTKHNSTSD